MRVEIAKVRSLPIGKVVSGQIEACCLCGLESRSWLALMFAAVYRNVEDDIRGKGNTPVLALLSLAMLLVSLDQYIVVVALPEIGRDLGYSAHTLQSVVSAYAVASSGFLLFGGRAADLLGRRRVLVTGLALYALASLAGGLATRPEVQLTARAVQGLGGALVFPSTLAVFNTTFAEGHDRNRALGIWGGAGAAGLVVGVGVLTRAFGWEAVFLINVPLAGPRSSPHSS